ncbi:hypothetical protein MOX02_38320 [Methylobacterium oxalidis]|uniref:Uncharacterized protein n=1 Tax=Methylobacterium oxalidis TaxID=944322 RepID=A0A512J748_9HYPH|nr:hypothetical protein MOX02_38320 [Methylobacterium oxalidis]
MKKKTVTPNTPGITDCSPEWEAMTRRMLTARRPSRPAIRPGAAAPDRAPCRAASGGLVVSLVWGGARIWGQGSKIAGSAR